MRRPPSAFQLGPYRIEVKIVSKEEMDKLDHGLKDPPWGWCDYDTNTLYVQKISKTHPRVQFMQTYWHEYFHMLFHVAGRPRLARDETLVDNCGSLHLQAEMTAEK